MAKSCKHAPTHKVGGPRGLVLSGQMAQTYFMSTFPAGGEDGSKRSEPLVIHQEDFPQATFGWSP